MALEKGAPDGGGRADVATRRKTAIALKLAGATWEQVAEQCGYAGAGAANADIGKFRKQQNLVAAANFEELRAQENERYDRLQMAYWPKALQGDKDAALIVLKIFDRRANTNGLNAPKDINLQLAARIDVEAAAVVDAILAAADMVELAPDTRMKMLEAAQEHLVRTAAQGDVIVGEIVSEVEDG
jgi:hypothetical protein